MNLNELLQAGNVVEDPVKWKNIQNLSSAILVVLSSIISLLKVFGYDVILTDQQLIVIAGIIAALLFSSNIIITTISSKKVGFEQKLSTENTK